MESSRSQPSYSTALPDSVIVVSQVILYLLTVLPLRIIYRARRRLPQNLKLLRQGSLVAANHQSLVDPFFITMSLPFRTYLRILPIRFPTADHILRNPIFNPRFFPLLRFFGCFSIGMTSQDGMRSIFYIRELLRNRKTVFLFPEGRRITDEKTVGELKQGIDFFMRQAVNIMFVRLHGFNEAREEHSARRITFSEVLEPPPAMSTVEMQQYLESL